MKIRRLLAAVLLLAVIACALVLRSRKHDYNVLINVPDVLYAYEDGLELDAINSTQSDIPVVLQLFTQEGENIFEVRLEPGEFVGNVDIDYTFTSGSSMVVLKVLAYVNHHIMVIDEKWLLVIKEVHE